MNIIYLSLGTNIGSREENLINAIELLKLSVDVLCTSSIYKTDPQDYESQNFFYNLVLKGGTNLSPMNLLNEINKIEKKLGRVRKKKVSDRIIDIDIILYSNHILDNPTLTIPHPRALNRRFVIEPLTEIDKNLVFPGESRNILDIANNLTDQKVKKLNIINIANK